MEWSPQQKAVFDWFGDANSGNALVVRARAGTGKTTTILEGIENAPEQKVLLAAFNKRIADELGKRLRHHGAEARTLHSLGWRLIRQRLNNVTIDKDRGWTLAETAAGIDKSAVIMKVRDLAAIVKYSFDYVPETYEIEEIIDNDPDCGEDDETMSFGFGDAQLAKAAREAVEMSLKDDGAVDFDDQLFMPVARGWVHPMYDLVCIDEAQDMSKVQLKLATGVCGGRIVVIGDDRQAIYGFRGADSTAIDRMKQELEAEELPLTITYRCPRKIVAHAQRLVPDYRAAPDAPEGILDAVSRDTLFTKVAPGDFVLSRTNAPLMGVCLNLIRNRVSARIEGRDIGEGLKALIKKLKPTNNADLAVKLDDWEKKQRAKAMAKGRTATADQVSDKAETLRVLIEDTESIYALQTALEQLFAPGVNQVICSTVHKAKGLESDHVFLLSGTLYPGGRTEVLEERNIEYVAVTRAKQHLSLVDGFGKRN